MPAWGDMRVRLTDPTQLEDFLDFVWSSGFIAEVEEPDLVRISLPYVLSRGRTAADGDLFLSLWLGVAVRVWNELCPEGEAVLLGEPEQAGHASYG
jgi:hypothetical protein